MPSIRSTALLLLAFAGSVTPATATAAIPTFLANCGTAAPVSRLSSACPCFLQSVTITTSTSTSISTSNPLTTSSATPSSSSSSSAIGECVCSSTLPGTESTCTPTTVTETAPGATVTELATETHTAPGPTTTITAPGPTTTVTSPPPARTCAEPLDDTGFEAFRPSLYPWTFNSGAGARWSTGQNRVGIPGSHWPYNSGGRPHSGEVAVCLHINEQAGSGPFWRLWQSINPCLTSTAYRPRLWYATNAASDVGTVTFRIAIYAASVGNPAAAPLVYSSIRTVSAFSGGRWLQVEFDLWTSADLATGVVHLDVTTTRANYVVWLDDITLRVQ